MTSEMLQSPPMDLSCAIPCHRCGYDVRAQPADGRCPECEASVAESRRLAVIPRRPAWRDSDPRWRRRMLAGAWVLVFVPLMDVLQAIQWSREIPAPIFFEVQRGQMLNDTYMTMLYVCLTFCIGVVLLFSKERNWQADRLDWTRRWGVIGSYLVFALGISQHVLITGLVIVGIGALFQAMPLAYQPAVTPWFVKVGTALIYHGPHGTPLFAPALAGFSSIVVLLGCVPLFNALRSSGPRALAVMLLAPLALASVVRVGYALLFALNLDPFPPSWLYWRLYYFNPQPLVNAIVDPSGQFLQREFLAEAAKWFACFGIAIWLSIAQIAAMRSARVTHRNPPPSRNSRK
jgi:hypothetical protein